MKQINLLFKNGTLVSVPYSSKVYVELTENLGKDHKVEARTYSVNTKNLDGVFFVVENDEAEA